MAQPDSELDLLRSELRGEGASKLHGVGVKGVSAPQSRIAGGRPAPDKWRAEPRPEPDSGKPTVRNRRGASGNVAHGGTRNPPRNRKGGRGNAPPVGARAWTLSRHPHAACDEAGVGNGLTGELVRHSHRKQGGTDRLHLRSTASAPDPTNHIGAHREARFSSDSDGLGRRGEGVHSAGSGHTEAAECSRRMRRTSSTVSGAACIPE